MVVEIVKWDIKPNHETMFEEAFEKAQKILTSSIGYKSHQFQKCIEKPDTYILIVEWERLEDHTEGFQNSVEYQEYRSLLKPHYEPGAVLEHYEIITKNTQ